MPQLLFLKKVIAFSLSFTFLICHSDSLAQYNTSSNGNWPDNSSWSGSAPPTVLGENASININHQILLNGNLTIDEDSWLTINGSGHLTITGNVNIDENFNLMVNGTLIIQGALIVDEGVSLTVNGSGSVIVDGPSEIGEDANIMINGDMVFNDDLDIGENATMTINGSGSLNVEENLTFDEGAFVTVNGEMIVGNNLTFGDPPPSNFSGGGIVIVGGSDCSQWTGSGPCTDNALLPVELTRFLAELRKQTIHLSWQTATELNNDYFTIERSQNGIHYEAIGKVQGYGTTNEQQDYEFADNNPLPGLSYYRLRQTDFDGTIEIFRPVSVVFEGLASASASVFPNPFSQSELTVSLQGVATLSDVQLDVLNVNGVPVYSTVVNAGSSSAHAATLRLDFLPKGYYVVRLSGNNINTHLKLIKE